MTIAELIKYYGDDGGLVSMDGYEDCVVGIMERAGQEPVLCYDRGKVLDKMVTRDGMTYTEALEYYEFNQLGAWVGDRTPCFLIRGDDDEKATCQESTDT